jgi:Domain of unknown function (DUF4388)
MARMIIDSGGRLSLPHTVVKTLGQQTLELSSFSEQHLLLTTRREKSSLVMAGALGEIWIADLLSFFNMFRKTGVLEFSFSGGSKQLFFQQGEIIFAASTFPDEDLGERLCALGMLDRLLLQRLRAPGSSSVAFGKLLVDKGVVTPKDLWHATRHQAETIVYNLFTMEQGSYFFVAEELHDEHMLRLSMSTQNLIMEGLRRVDERALFMRRILSEEHVPVPSGKPAVGVPPAAGRMLRLLNTERCSVRELLRKAGGGEFEGLRLLHQLVEKGWVCMEEAPTVAVDGALGNILNIFNSALSVLYRRVSDKKPGFAQEVRAFLRDLPQPFSFVFRDVALRDDGSIDGGRILANLAGLEEGDKQRLLVESLTELIYMESSIVRQELSTAESGELLQRVQEVTRRVKSLMERKR